MEYDRSHGEERPAEELEHIPWSALADEQTAGRNRFLYLAAAIIAAVAIGMTAGRALLRPGAEPAPAGVAAVAAPSDTTSPPSVTSTALPAPSLYSEADLMAAITAETDRAVVAKAEWFVTDYFTTDGDEMGAADIDAALPSGAVRPELPHERDAEAVSYVEWSRAVRATELIPGRFRVTVAFRTVERADAGFLRRPVRAVDLLVELAPTGGASIVDLPSPASLPAASAPAAWPEMGAAQVPIEVAAVATAEAGRWGGLPTVLGGTLVDEAWRVLVEVGTDESGTRWPMVVWIDQEGYPVPPGYTS